LCQEVQAEREFLKNGLFNPSIREGHTSVFAECFARNLGTWWVLAALVFSAVS
jgi:hypothetical protein